MAQFHRSWWSGFTGGAQSWVRTLLVLAVATVPLRAGNGFAAGCTASSPNGRSACSESTYEKERPDAANSTQSINQSGGVAIEFPRARDPEGGTPGRSEPGGIASGVAGSWTAVPDAPHHSPRTRRAANLPGPIGGSQGNRDHESGSAEWDRRCGSSRAFHRNSRRKTGSGRRTSPRSGRSVAS